jgi:serine/threonine protein kinase
VFLTGNTNQFRIIRALRRSPNSNAFLYQAEQLDGLRRPSVVLKFYRRGAVAQGQNTLLDAQNLAMCNDRRICGLISIDRAGGEDFLVMPFIKGASIRELVRPDDWTAPVLMEPSTALNIARQVCFALEHMQSLPATQAMVHRDLHWGNVMYNRENGDATVLDFGLAALFPDPQRLADPGATLTDPVGIVAFMSPERLRLQVVRPGEDLYALAVLLFFMLAGELPFDETDLEKRSPYFLLDFLGEQDVAFVQRRAILTRLQAFLVGALKYESTERPATAREFREKVEAFLIELEQESRNIQGLAFFDSRTLLYNAVNVPASDTSKARRYFMTFQKRTTSSRALQQVAEEIAAMAFEGSLEFLSDEVQAQILGFRQQLQLADDDNSWGRLELSVRSRFTNEFWPYFRERLSNLADAGQFLVQPNSAKLNLFVPRLAELMRPQGSLSLDDATTISEAYAESAEILCSASENFASQDFQQAVQRAGIRRPVYVD